VSGKGALKLKNAYRQLLADLKFGLSGEYM
jgi:hypothetical protein